RDVAFLEAVGKRTDRPTDLFSAIRVSNEMHKAWPRRRLVEVLNTIRGKRVAVLGLTYKPGTDTLRRSSALDLCRWLQLGAAGGAAVDPAVANPEPPGLEGLPLAPSAKEALRRAAAAVIVTEWPEFAAMPAATFVEQLSSPPTVLDPNGLLEKTLGL